jgi:hypothetical protein
VSEEFDLILVTLMINSIILSSSDTTTTPDSPIFFVSTRQVACDITLVGSSESSMFFTNFPPHFDQIPFPHVNIIQNPEKNAYKIYFDGAENKTFSRGHETFTILWTAYNFRTEMSGNAVWDPFQINFIGVHSE